MAASLSIAAMRIKVKGTGESILFGWDFTKLLVSGETLSSVTSITCTAASQSITDGATVATTDLTLAAGSVNSSATFANDEGGTVAISSGVQGRISGGVHGGDYTIRCRVATSASNTRDIYGTLQARDS